MEAEHSHPARKALEINLDPAIYGTFAEIGAGQEVARYFFKAGRASGTIAKSMSAYDMVFSDAIYGREDTGRYVCEKRLSKMLRKEFELLVERLDESRGERTTFFAFADTVATGAYHHGWLGVRLQTRPRGPANEICLHVNLLDRNRLQQQEALGVLGVNLIHCAFYYWNNPKEFLPALVENLGQGRIEIDMLKFCGPDLEAVDNHLMALELIRMGLTRAVFFDAEGNMQQPSEMLYHRAVVLQRGNFRPLVNANLKMQEAALRRLKSATNPQDPLSVLEINIHDMIQARFDFPDLLHRVETMAALRQPVIISDYPDFHDLKNFLRRYTKEPLMLVAGAPLLGWLFDEPRYKDLPGGLVEAMGHLFDSNTGLMIYPYRAGNKVQSASTFRLHGPGQKLYEYLVESGRIGDLELERDDGLVLAEDVRRMLDSGGTEWKKHVPPKVAEFIEQRGFFRS